MSSIARRQLKDRFFFLLIVTLASISFIPLLFIISFILVKGLAHLSPHILFDPPPVGSPHLEDVGKGGLLSPIVGSIIIAFFSFVIASPIGILIGLFIGEKKGAYFAVALEIASDIIYGIPSIIIGIVAFAWFVRPTGEYSGLSASIALAIMMLPVIISVTAHRVKAIPDSLREAAYALGATENKVLLKVILPISLPSIFTGITLAVGRIMGETAPLIFTAFGTSLFLQTNIFREMDSLPLKIFVYTNSPYPNLQQLAWNASLVLILMIFALNLLSRVIYNKYKVSL